MTRRLAKQVIRTNRFDLRYRFISAAQFVHPAARVIVKDPIGIHLAPFMWMEFGVPTIVVVRHPAAVLLSRLRRGWGPGSLDPLRAQPDFWKMWGSRAALERYEKADVWERAGIFYRLHFSPAVSHVTAHPDAGILFSYEELVADPTSELERAASFLSWGSSPEALRHASAAMNGRDRSHRGSDLSRVQARDAAAAAYGWRDADITNADLLRLRRGLGGLADQLFPRAADWVVKSQR